MGDRSNLLEDRELFVGRADECAKLAGAIHAGERQITIIGPSGTGKTRLARQVARGLVPEFAGGVWFCALSASRTADELVANVVMALELPVSEGDASTQLGRALANRGPLLLVLDNGEHLEEDAHAVISSWLSQAPKLQILSTSLARFGSPGESVFELGPLGADDAIALYQERANRAWGGERVFFSGERRAVEELMQRLDRLPLAIELAAARVRVLPPRAMLSKIEDRFELLRSRGTAWHSSLEQALHCSWELLDTWEREVLARASVFVGGFTLDAAEEVLGGGERGSVLDVLEGLRDKALLQLGGSAHLRFSLYESVKVFAARELERAGEVDATMRCHAAFFIRRKGEWIEAVSGREMPGSTHGLAAERENFIASFRWLEPREPLSAVHAGIAASVASGLVGASSAEIGLLDDSVAIARRTGDRLLLARALQVRAMALQRHGTLELVRRDVDEGLALARELDEPRLEGYLLCEVARVHVLRRELDRAAVDLGRLREIETELNEPYLAGRIRMALAMDAASRGVIGDVRRWLWEALEIFRRCGDVRSQARVLHNLGLFLAGAGQYDGVRAALDEARAMSRVSGEWNADAEMLLVLGSVEYTAGRLAEAEECLTAALPLQRSFGSRRWEGLTLGVLGQLALEQGEIQLATQRFQDANVLFVETGDDLAILHHLPFVAAAKAMSGRLAEARADFLEARKRFEENGDAVGLACAGYLEGFLDLGDARLAVQELRAADASSAIARATMRLTHSDDVFSGSYTLTRARRLLSGALDRYRNLAAQADGGAEQGAPVGADGVVVAGMVVGPDAEWFELEGRPRVELSVPGPRRRLLQALVLHRLLEPGVGLGLQQLSELGWPDEKLDSLVTRQRVYDIVKLLRRSGLGELLLRHDDGYLLAPNVPVRWAQG